MRGTVGSSPQNLFSTELCFLLVAVQSWSITIMVSIITILCINRGSSKRFPNQKRMRRILATVSTKHTNVEKPSASLVRWILRYCGIKGTIPPNTIAACEPKVTIVTIHSFTGESPSSCAILKTNRDFPVTWPSKMVNACCLCSRRLGLSMVQYTSGYAAVDWLTPLTCLCSNAARKNESSHHSGARWSKKAWKRKESWLLQEGNEQDLRQGTFCAEWYGPTTWEMRCSACSHLSLL